MSRLVQSSLSTRGLNEGDETAEGSRDVLCFVSCCVVFLFLWSCRCRLILFDICSAFCASSLRSIVSFVLRLMSCISLFSCFFSPVSCLLSSALRVLSLSPSLCFSRARSLYFSLSRALFLSLPRSRMSPLSLSLLYLTRRCQENTLYLCYSHSHPCIDFSLFLLFPTSSNPPLSHARLFKKRATCPSSPRRGRTSRPASPMPLFWVNKEHILLLDLSALPIRLWPLYCLCSSFLPLDFFSNVYCRASRLVRASH